MPLPNNEFFRPPTRVSRFYPLFSLILLLAGSGTIYTWQLTQINADVAVQTRDKEIVRLNGQVTTLTEQQTKDQSTLAVQGKQLQETTSRLTEIEQQLTQKQQALIEAEAKLAQQENQLSSNATELQQLRDRPPLFSFQNKSNLADATEKQAQIKELVTSAYSYLQDLYGKPYLLNQITITFVNEFSIAGSAGEIIIENSSKGISIDIHLKDFDVTSFQDNNTLIHEIAHSYHGIAVFDDSALEEGIAVAVTDAVMERMIMDNKLPQFPSLYLSLSEAQYNHYNENFLVKAGNTDFYQSENISKIYQLLGKAWFNLYREDPQFFKKFNESYYKEVQLGVNATQAMVRKNIAAVIKEVNTIPIGTYLAENQAFNPR